MKHGLLISHSLPANGRAEVPDPNRSRGGGPSPRQGSDRVPSIYAPSSEFRTVELRAFVFLRSVRAWSPCQAPRISNLPPHRTGEGECGTSCVANKHFGYSNFNYEQFNLYRVSKLSNCFFFLNIFQDCIQPFSHEMLSWVRLHGINAHSVSPPAR